MYEIRLAEQIPLWLVYLASVAIVVLSIKGGLVLGRMRRKRVDAVQEGPIGAVVGATLGLLAFMLAFTFGLAAARRDAKRDLLLNEVNAIGTTYLRASLIPEPHQSEVRKLLKRYVDIRCEFKGTPAKLRDAIKESKQVQTQLWTHAAALADANLKNPDIVSLFVDSLNETIDLQTKRVTVALYHIPEAIWIVLIALSIVSMAIVGYHFALSGRASWLVIVGLALSFSMVIVLIADLDRVTSGWLSIDNQPMIELQSDLNTGQPATPPNPRPPARFDFFNILTFPACALSIYEAV